ncbi:MAG: TonB family protein [Chitinivibrionales bacterium]|nr:TonB family protein [Chitinivibrionales bacterium]
MAPFGFGQHGTPGGGGDIEDLLGDMSATDALPLTMQPRRKVNPIIDVDETVHRLLGDGGRSRESIQRTVARYMPALRYAYTVRLRRRPGLQGKITVRFVIDEFGNVVNAVVEESTIGDPELERTVVAKIRRWKFERIDKPGDMTEIVYPFVFSS